ncbi:MAG: cation diffusion facilitator family transporter [Geobacteraceae bacterium]|nr:cation diffusion facilitator family transporter [Geobacteraceae bacterium]
MNSDVEKKELLRRGQRVAFVSSLVTLGVAVVKGAIGAMYGSQLLIADAFHSAGDVVTVAASAFGLWLAARKKSEKFPYGLYRAETVASLFMGLLILWAGVEMARDGYLKLLKPEATGENPLFPAGAALLSIIANLFMAKRQKEAGEAINSQSLLAKSRDTRLDTYVSAVVLIGILLASRGIPHVEGCLILLISLLILKLGAETLWVSVMSLLDANLDPDLQTEIGSMCAAIEGVRSVSHVRIRPSGPFRMVDCTIQTSPDLSLYKAHELADQVEEVIVSGHRDIDTVFVHVEPYRRESLLALIPVMSVNGLESVIHEHFGRAPYFAIVRIGRDDATLEDFYYNEFLDEKLHIGVKITKAISGAGVDILFTKQIGELAFSLLKERFVDIYLVEGALSAREIIDAYLKNRLLRLHAPTHGIDESESGRAPEQAGMEESPSIEE